MAVIDIAHFYVICISQLAVTYEDKHNLLILQQHKQMTCKIYVTFLHLLHDTPDKCVEASVLVLFLLVKFGTTDLPLVPRC